MFSISNCRGKTSANARANLQMCTLERSVYSFVFVLLLCVQISKSALAPYESPCPEVFQYMTDERNTLYGSIQVLRPFDNVIQLSVEISVGNSIQGYNGHIELGYSRLKAVEDIMNRRPLRYRLHFPVWMNIPPQITKISVNGERICSGSALDIKSVPVLTTVNLQHTLRINVTPGSTGTTPEIRVDPPPRTSDPFYGINNPSQENNPYVPSNIQFNPQPPTDPEKVYPTNPFLNFLPQNTVSGDRAETTPVNRNDIVPISEQTRATTPKISIRNSLSNVCGKSLYVNTNELVAFGRPAGKGQYPWLAAIYTIKTSGLEFTCGGNLISTKHVVTAAHCMKQQDRKLRIDQVLTILGKYNIQKWTNGEGLFLNAQRISIHPDYKPRTADADLAVITLEEEVKFTDLIRPVCLWTEISDLSLVVGQKGAVIGWGKDENGLLISPEPKQISLPIVSQEECIRSHDTFFDITSERTFCAGFKNGSGPCNGDSGGGFIMQRSGQWRLKGLVSMSLSNNQRSCDLSQYVVFTDVSKFSDWLLSFL